MSAEPGRQRCAERRNAERRIADIMEAIERCRRYVGVLDQGVEAGIVDMAEGAIERNLQIIGGAANHLPAEVTDTHPEIAWPQIRGFRRIHEADSLCFRWGIWRGCRCRQCPR